MANLQTDIDIFINRAQQKIGTLGDDILSLDLNGLDLNFEISLVRELSASIYLFQNQTLSENFSYKIIHYLSEKANLYIIPLVIFDDSLLVKNILLPSGGYTTGPQGPQGDAATISLGPITTLPYTQPATVFNSGNSKAAIFNFAIPQGVPGTNGTNGDIGWSAVYSIVNNGTRRVLEVVSWIGGTGTPPTPINVYLGPTGFVSDITLAVDIRGIPGIDGSVGNDGNNGWSPIYAIVNDSTRRVLQIIAWTGGSGPEPATGDYIYSGGQTADISVATDIRGPQGIQGDPFTINARGNISDRNIYDNQGTGYTFLAEDTGDVYIKNSPISGDWSPPISFVGEKGWSPLFNTVEDGQRILIQASDWVGGQGIKPDNQGYIYPGGFTNNPSDATDFRGPRGEFFIDASGPLSDRPIYDNQNRPFAYYANDNGSVYLKNSNTAADWTVGFEFTGPRGPAGPAGSTGASGKFKGEWASGSYLAGEVVLHEALLWEANNNNTNEEPGTGPSWDLQITNDDAYGFGYNGSLLGVTQNRFYQVVEGFDDIYYRLDGEFPLAGDMDADGNNILNAHVIRSDLFVSTNGTGPNCYFAAFGDYSFFQMNEDSTGVFDDAGKPAPGIVLFSIAGDSEVQFYTSASNGVTADLQAKFDADGVLKVLNNDIIVNDITKGYGMGDSATDGSWRRRIDGGDLIEEKRVSGSWVEKSRIS